jgi:carbon-monoxide dehydrogenase medium subunit
MLKPFTLHEPSTVAEASSLLRQHGESARLYAGGTELVLVMKHGLAHYDHVVNVKRIPALGGLRLDGDVLRIGAAATHRAIERNDRVRGRLPALTTLERGVANVRVRNVGTLGGNLAFAEPHADPGTLLLALQARVRAQRDERVRHIPMEEFFIDAYTTALQPDEVLVEVEIPLPPPDTAAAFLKFGFLERPSVNVAAVVSVSDGLVREARLAVGCVGPKPARCPRAEARLAGVPVRELPAAAEAAGAEAAREIDPLDDLHGSTGFKRHVAGVLAQRALAAAAEGLNGGGGG